MTSVVDFLVDKRLSRVASWFDVAGALGALAFVVVWLVTQQTDMVLYGLLLWVVLHGFLTTQIVTKRRSRRASADQVVVDYRELRRSHQYPSGSENPHGRSASPQPIDARRRRTPDRTPA
ncbi:membrane protein [Mycobacterium phage Phabba]|uniref:Membrane protein n=1 Tax=Mycobacterium phage Phabba TaxID=2027899 RepID=A0A249XSR5_9CAUD|nr:membrane protein [Mycobacterium phage Phabba]ASZ74771.1 membrane protein [Mycobacterium phage Phabba]